MTVTTNHTVDARHHGAVTNQIGPDPEVPERARPPWRFSADWHLACPTAPSKVGGLAHAVHFDHWHGPSRNPSR